MRSGDVLGKVLESESVATRVFEATVDSFGGAVRGVGILEVGRAVPHSAFDSLAQRDVVAGRLVTRVETGMLISVYIWTLAARVSGSRYASIMFW